MKRLPIVTNDDEVWDCEVKVNIAILEITRHGVGPAHINLPTTYEHRFDVQKLPSFRKMERITTQSDFPKLPKGRIAVFISSHSCWSKKATDALEEFCESNNALIICDHTSGYHGKYRINYTLAG